MPDLFAELRLSTLTSNCFFGLRFIFLTNRFLFESESRLLMEAKLLAKEWNVFHQHPSKTQVVWETSSKLVRIYQSKVRHPCNKGPFCSCIPLPSSLSIRPSNWDFLAVKCCFACKKVELKTRTPRHFAGSYLQGYYIGFLLKTCSTLSLLRGWESDGLVLL